MNYRKIACVLEDGGFLPRRAHPWDAGLDLYTPEDVLILPGQAVWVDIRVRMQIPQGECGIIKSKSGLALRDSVLADTGVIDAGYTGTIGVRLWNTGERIKRFQRGDKIAQMVIVKCDLSQTEIVETLPETERGDGGFGSTGK